MPAPSRNLSHHPPWGDLLRAFFSKGQSVLMWEEQPSLLPSKSPGGGHSEPHPVSPGLEGMEIGRAREGPGPPNSSLCPCPAPGQPRTTPITAQGVQGPGHVKALPNQSPRLSARGQS